MEPNIKAFLDMIAISELGEDLIKLSDNGYDVLVGSTAKKPLLFKRNELGFPDYSDHPRIYNKKMDSTAAGRYQLLSRYYDSYKKLLNLKDFSPESQDAIAIQQIKEQKALSLILSGNIEGAIIKCNNIWASFTGSPYGQNTHPIEYLIAAYASSFEINKTQIV